MLKSIFTVFLYIFAIIGLILVLGYFAVNLGLTNTSGIIDKQNDYFKKTPNEIDVVTRNYVWNAGKEWETFSYAVINDSISIISASRDANINPRLIVAQLFVEQMRLYYTERALFEEVFAPLKLFGNQIQFSWGVMGLKQETAIQIEENLKNTNSPYYIGKEYENLLDFKTNDRNTERFERIIDENSRYYSYLYSALLLRQLETQWQNAGYSISNRPEILSTLFNIGFDNSKPNANPKSGGSEIKIGDNTYSFGSLAAEFYHSNELMEQFPN